MQDSGNVFQLLAFIKHQLHFPDSICLSHHVEFQYFYRVELVHKNTRTNTQTRNTFFSPLPPETKKACKWLCSRRGAIGEREPAQPSAAAGDVPAAARRAAVALGAAERAERVEERRGAEETRGEGEGAAAGAGPRARQGASSEGQSHLKAWIIRKTTRWEWRTSTGNICY